MGPGPVSENQPPSPWGEPAAAYIRPSTSSSEVGSTTNGQVGISTSSATRAIHIQPHFVQRPSRVRRAFRMTSSSVGLLIIAAGLGLALAAALGALVWLIATAIHQAAVS